MESLLPNEVAQRIARCGAIAVLVVDDARQAALLARTLVQSGIDVMELTLRTPAALESLRRVRAEVPEMLAGIGTVLTPRQVDEVADLGAAFAVAPGTNAHVIEAAARRGLPFMPGVATPSDLEAALEFGCRHVKFFPAEPCGGLSYLRNMSAPYAHLGVRFVPLGGLTAANLPDYFREPAVLAVGGSWIASRKMIQEEAWETIRANAVEVCNLVSTVRGGGR